MPTVRTKGTSVQKPLSWAQYGESEEQIGDMLNQRRIEFRHVISSYGRARPSHRPTRDSEKDIFFTCAPKTTLAHNLCQVEKLTLGGASDRTFKPARRVE